MQVVYDGLRSPTEFESTPIIAHVLQEYFLRFMGRYQEFVQPEGSLRDPALASDDPTQSGPSLIRMSGDIRARPSLRQSPKAAGPPGGGPRAGADDDGYLRYCLPCCTMSGHLLLVGCGKVTQGIVDIRALIPDDIISLAACELSWLGHKGFVSWAR